MDPIPLNTTLLERLGLVRPDQWPAIQRRARRMSSRKGVRYLLPKRPEGCFAETVPDTFSAIWIDAMLQLGHITPYQAKWLQDEKEELLQVGPYVLLNRRESLGWADCFDAYRVEDRQRVYLAVLRGSSPETWEVLQDQLEKEAIEVERESEQKGTGTFSAKTSQSPFALPQDVGVDTRAGVWIATAPCSGESVAQQMVQHGRFSPRVVLEVARQMVRALSQLQSQRKTHGDLRATTVLLDREHGLKLLLPGVRAVVRPRESFAETDGPIDMYDGLSPERAAEGTVADVKSDLFAAGSLWWQMLVGRSPTPGGDGRAKLRTAARGEVEDVHRHAAEVPKSLARAIGACTARNRADRPDSFDEVAKMLGEPDARGVRALRRAIRGNRVTALPVVSTESVSRHTRYLGWGVTAIGILVATVALGLAADKFLHPKKSEIVVLPKPLPPKTKPEPVPKNPGKTNPVQPVVPTGDNEDPIFLPDPMEKVEPDRIVLDAKQPIAAETLAARLKPGLVVAGPPGKRTQVLISDQALTVAVPKVRFEDIDFVIATSDEEKPDGTTSTNSYRVMIELRDGEATFVGCTFHGEHDKKSTPWTVIHWIFPDTSRAPDISKLPDTLPNGRIVFENCVFGHEMGTALHAEVHAAVAVELRNVLHLGAGPMIFLESPPKLEEPWRIRADRVTLRDSGPFWACRYRSTRAGAVRIETRDSVFAPKGTQSLLLFVGENDPEPIFRKIEWTGRETLIQKKTPTAAWQDNRGNRDPLSDQHASIDGLVRSQIEFRGPADRSPSSSVLQTWDAPLTSETPPGIDAKRLPFLRDVKED